MSSSVHSVVCALIMWSLIQQDFNTRSGNQSTVDMQCEFAHADSWGSERREAKNPPKKKKKNEFRN